MQTNFTSRDHAERDFEQRKTELAREATQEVQAAAATMLLAGSSDGAAPAPMGQNPNALAGPSQQVPKSGTQTVERQYGHSGSGTSKYRGVSWAARSRKWRVQLWFSSNVRPYTLSFKPGAGGGACARPCKELTLIPSIYY